MSINSFFSLFKSKFQRLNPIEKQQEQNAAIFVFLEYLALENARELGNSQRSDADNSLLLIVAHALNIRQEYYDSKLRSDFFSPGFSLPYYREVLSSLEENKKYFALKQGLLIYSNREDLSCLIDSNGSYRVNGKYMTLLEKFSHYMGINTSLELTIKGLIIELEEGSYAAVNDKHYEAEQKSDSEIYIIEDEFIFKQKCAILEIVLFILNSDKHSEEQNAHIIDLVTRFQILPDDDVDLNDIERINILKELNNDQITYIKSVLHRTLELRVNNEIVNLEAVLNTYGLDPVQFDIRNTVNSQNPEVINMDVILDNVKSPDEVNYEDCYDIGNVTYYKEQPLTGFLFKCDANGEILFKMQMENGLKHGVTTHYYNEGESSRLNNYKKDKLDGLQLDWFKSGKIAKICSYKKDEPNGVHKEFNEEGNLIVHTIYDNGKINGISKIFWQNGLLHQEISFVQNMKHGVTKVYTEKGELETEILFEHNEEISREINPSLPMFHFAEKIINKEYPSESLPDSPDQDIEKIKLNFRELKNASDFSSVKEILDFLYKNELVKVGVFASEYWKGYFQLSNYSSPNKVIHTDLFGESAGEAIKIINEGDEITIEGSYAKGYDLKKQAFYGQFHYWGTGIIEKEKFLNRLEEFVSENQEGLAGDIYPFLNYMDLSQEPEELMGQLEAFNIIMATGQQEYSNNISWWAPDEIKDVRFEFFFFED